MRITKTIVDSLLIWCYIEIIFWNSIVICKISSRSKNSTVSSSCCNTSGIHKSDCCHLPIDRIRSVSIREISGCMSNTKSVISWCITCSKTRTATCSLNNSSSFYKSGNCTFVQQIQINRLRRWINRQGKSSIATTSIA